MKKIILLFLLLPFIAIAQPAEPKSIINGKIFKNLKPTYGAFDFYYASSEIHNTRLNGFGFGMGYAFNNFWMPGMSFEFYSSKSIQLDVAVPVVNSAYNTSFIQISNEFIFASNKIISLGVPLRFGFGYTNYYDKYSNQNYNRSIVDDTYFIADAGVLLYINLLKHTSLSGGFNYRYASGVQRVGTNDDFTNYAFFGKIRFRLFNSTKKNVDPNNSL